MTIPTRTSQKVPSRISSECSATGFAGITRGGIKGLLPSFCFSGCVCSCRACRDYARLVAGCGTTEGLGMIGGSGGGDSGFGGGSFSRTGGWKTLGGVSALTGPLVVAVETSRVSNSRNCLPRSVSSCSSCAWRFFRVSNCVRSNSFMTAVSCCL